VAIIEPDPPDVELVTQGQGQGERRRVFGTDRLTRARRTALTSPEGILGCKIVHASPGRMEGRMPAPMGRPEAVGWLAFLIDALGGRPIHTLLSARSAPRTVELRIDVTSEQARPGELLRATSEVESLDEWSGLSHIRVQGADGRLLGIGTGRFAVVPEEPYATVPAEPAPPSGAFGGGPAEFLDVRPDGPGVLVRLRPRLANQYGALHGGVHCVAAEVALDRAVAGDRSLPGRLQTLNVSYLRPALTRQGEARLSAEVTKAGRRVVTAAGALVGAGDKVLATFDGIYLRGSAPL
jgi:acyl-coenzyme A thioesterase PaaI-like protein